MPDASLEFPRVLSGAIADAGLTLETITHLLHARGLKLSAASLSYWCTGRSLPTRASSLEVVAELEKILGLEPGRLVSALAETSHDLWRPARVLPGQLEVDALAAAGLDLDRHATVPHLHDRLDEHSGRRATTTTHLVLRSEHDGLRRLAVLLPSVLGVSAAPRVEGLDGCTTDGPYRVATGTDDLPPVWAVGLGLPRPLAAGELAAVEVRSRWEGVPASSGLVRVTPSTTRFLVLEAELLERARAVEHRIRSRADGPWRTTDLDAAGAHVVQHTADDAPSGLHLLCWEA